MLWRTRTSSLRASGSTRAWRALSARCGLSDARPGDGAGKAGCFAQRAGDCRAGKSGGAGGEDLLQASDAIYYRTKATYVLWMLRDMVGERRSRRRCRPTSRRMTRAPEYFEHLVEQTTRQADLKWFFDDWVYRDRGLPDLSIVGVYPSKSSVAGSWLVAVEIANDGYVQAFVPVTVRSQGTQVTNRILLPPRAHYYASDCDRGCSGGSGGE